MLIAYLPPLVLTLLTSIITLITDFFSKNLFQTNITYFFHAWVIVQVLNTNSLAFLFPLVFLLNILTVTLPGQTIPFEYIAAQIAVLIAARLFKRHVGNQFVFACVIALIAYFMYPENRCYMGYPGTISTLGWFTFTFTKLIVNAYCFIRFLKYTSAAKLGNRL